MAIQNRPCFHAAVLWAASSVDGPMISAHSSGEKTPSQPPDDSRRMIESKEVVPRPVKPKRHDGSHRRSSEEGSRKQDMAKLLYRLSQQAETIRVTSPAGTDLLMTVDKKGIPSGASG
jgi:hypothetical protein